MRRLLFQTTALLSFTVFGAYAQEVIIADVTQGCDELTVQFKLDNASDSTIYSLLMWDFGDGVIVDGVFSPTHTYAEAKKYDVRCTLDEGREPILQEDFITVSETPRADFKYELVDTVNAVFEYTFEPEYFKPIEGIELDYTWRFRVKTDSIELNENTPSYSFSKRDTCFVTLWINDEIGCVDSTDEAIMVRALDSLWIPNVFTPNDDGDNDIFKVTTSGDDYWWFRVFSVDGLLLFSSRSNEIIWDGSVNGDRKVPSGVYFYRIVKDEVPVSKETEHYEGYIYVFR
jgi:gliding motility-associated-like protein